MPGRRDNGEGSIYQRKDGRYAASIRLPDGRRPEFTSKDKATAEAWRKTARRLLEEGRAVPTSTQTVERYLIDWLEGLMTVSVTTRETYAKRIRWVAPYIGHHKLSTLKPQHIQAAYRTLQTERHLSSRTVYSTHGTLRLALQKAVEWDLIPRNPTDAVDSPSVDNPEMKTLTEAELMALFTASLGDEWHPLWMLLGTTGLRIGEALALKWDYVSDDTIRIVQTIRAERGNGLVSVKPKTKKSNRTLDLTMHCSRALRAHRMRQSEQRLRVGPLWAGQNFVFTNDDGSPIHRERVARAFKKALKEAKIHPIRLHDLRHTYATLQLEHAVNVKKVSEALGHSDIGITLSTYGHVTPQMDREAVTCMETMLANGGL